MFTGIIEEIGEITAIAPAGDGWRLTVRAPRAVSDAAVSYTHLTLPTNREV